MNHLTCEDFRNEFVMARSIVKRTPELSNLSFEALNEKLNQLSDESRKYKLSIIASIYVEHIHDFSYEALLTFLNQVNVSMYSCKHIMFLLQDEHCISCFTLLHIAIKHNLAEKILPFICNNFVYEMHIDQSILQTFFNDMHIFPQSKQYYVFSDVAELILNHSLEEYTFIYLANNYTPIADIFLSYLLSTIYNKQNNNKGDQYLKKAISSSNASIWINSIVAGLQNSLIHNVTLFENEYESLQLLAEIETNWKKLIICYISYILSDHSRTPVVSESVVEKLKTITNSNIEIKEAFLQTVACQNNKAVLIDEIVLSICDHPFSKSKEQLELFDIFFSQNIHRFSVDTIRNHMFKLYINNSFSKLDSNDFFSCFSCLWSDLQKKHQETLQSFILSFLEPADQSLGFALGWMDNALDISLNSVESNDIFDIELNLASLIIRTITSITLRPEPLCMLSFILCKYIDNSFVASYTQTILDELYSMYPYTLYKIALLVSSCKASPFVKKLAFSIMDKHNEKQKKQNQCQNIPDLFPSQLRREIYRIEINERNKRIQNMAKEKSLLAQYFPTQHMKYGKRNVILRSTEQNTYDYVSGNYMLFESDIELPMLYCHSPAEWIIHQQDLLKERMNYIETNN